MNSKGFMRLHRQLLDWEWFDNSQMVHIWIYFLLKANFQESKWHGIDIPRGSFITSLDTICKDTGLSLQNVRTCMNKLKSTGEITTKSTNKYSVITICKYETYNSQDSDSNKQNNKQTNILLTSKQQANNTNLTTEKESKEIEELKKENERLKEELSNASKKKTRKVSELDFSFVAPDFVDVVRDWLEYKKERGESYKSKGFSSFYKKLLELSHNNPAAAKKIIEQSKSNNYAGIFPLKKTSEYGYVEYKPENGRYDEAKKWIAEFQK